MESNTDNSELDLAERLLEEYENADTSRKRVIKDIVTAIADRTGAKSRAEAEKPPVDTDDAVIKAASRLAYYAIDNTYGEVRKNIQKLFISLLQHEITQAQEQSRADSDRREGLHMVFEDAIDLQRQRDILMNIVQRMCITIGIEDIGCMRQFCVEMHHMLLEGMFFSEKHAYSKNPVEE